MKSFFLLFITLITACWSFEASESNNQSSFRQFPLLELPFELIPEIGRRLPYRDYQSLSSAKKALRNTLKAQGRRIQIVQDVTKENLSDLISALQRNSQARGIIFKDIIQKSSNETEPNAIKAPFIVQLFENLAPYLNTMKGLKELKLFNCTITPELIEVISNLERLEGLTIEVPYAQMSFSLNNLSKLPVLKALELLELPAGYRPGTNLEVLIPPSKFKTFKSLQFLTLKNFALTDATLSDLKEMPNLKDLELYNVRNLSLAYDMPQLKRVVADTTISYILSRAVKAFPNLTELHAQSGNFRGLNYEVNFLEEAAHLKNFAQLKILRMASMGIKNQMMDIICGLNNLTELDLGNCKKIPAEQFLLLKNLTNLQKLNVYRTQVDDKGADAISTLSKLKNLNIGDCPHITKFDFLRTLGSLKELKIWNTKIGIEGLEIIGSLTNLTDLTLDECSLDLGGIKYFRTLKYLKGLSMMVTNINDENVEIISTLPNLKRLGLANCASITPKGFILLHNLKFLEHLIVYTTQFNPTFFVPLLEEKEKNSDYQTFPYLHTIRMDKKNFPSEFLEKIRQYFPRVKINEW